MIRYFLILILFFDLKRFCTRANFYPSYAIIYEPLKAREWSDDRSLSYVTTVRLFDFDHHIFQYRRYPCQYFYTDKIQINYNNQTINECIYNTTASDYQYSFQLQLETRQIESYILRNIAIQCKYVNCSLSLLTMKYLRIDWNLQGRKNNLNCTFDANQRYEISYGPHTFSERIVLRCNSLTNCTRSKSNIESSFLTNTQLLYGSSYELETPYCSLEKNLGTIIETNLLQTNRLLEQLVNILQRGFGRPNVREQKQMKEYIEQKWIQNETNSTTEPTAFRGEIQGTFQRAK